MIAPLDANAASSFAASTTGSGRAAAFLFSTSRPLQFWNQFAMTCTLLCNRTYMSVDASGEANRNRNDASVRRNGLGNRQGSHEYDRSAPQHRGDEARSTGNVL